MANSDVPYLRVPENSRKGTRLVLESVSSDPWIEPSSPISPFTWKGPGPVPRRSEVENLNALPVHDTSLIVETLIMLSVGTYQAPSPDWGRYSTEGMVCAA